MKNENLKVGEIVQLNPDEVGNKSFAGALMVVTELKSFGAMGYVQSLGSRTEAGGQAYYRANWHEMEKTGGFVEWLVK